jgi:hypothetical protein
MRRETSQTVAKRREREGEPATVHDETRRRIAKWSLPRVALLIALAEHLRGLALAGDFEAARVASCAISRLLGVGETQLHESRKLDTGAGGGRTIESSARQPD